MVKEEETTAQYEWEVQVEVQVEVSVKYQAIDI